MVEVVAALIVDKEKFMICQRPKNKARPLLWEFPGGKVEKGESLFEALIRECREELDIEIEPFENFMDVVHTYPDISIHLSLIKAHIRNGEPKLLEHNDLKWITAKELDNYPFCPADEVIIERLKKEISL